MFENTPAEIYRFRDLILEREGYRSYEEFLKSSYWIGIKEKTKLLKYKGKYDKCKNCNTTENIQLHHEDYKWLLHKRELLNIIPLCKVCHEKLHFVAHHLNMSFKEAKKIIMLGVLNMDRIEDVLLLKKNSQSINYHNMNSSNQEIEKLKNNKIIMCKTEDSKESKNSFLEVKSEIIRPKSNLANNKRFATDSISSIRKKINAVSNLKMEESKQQDFSNKHFSQEDLEEKWNNFADLRKIEGKMGLFTTLNQSKPIIKDDFLISFEIDSEVQKIEFQTVSQLLLDFLRSELQNGKIVLDLTITSTKNSKLNQLSSRERFFQVAEEHPEIHAFKEQKIFEYEKTNNGDTEKAVLELIKDFEKTL